jgi:DNA polymerase III subunit gamma/tau
VSYLSLYRKYRPQTFEALVGQKHVARTLKNAIAAGKVAHAYLFCGPRGTGKTTTARLLAKALNCEAGPTPEPDDTCDMCRAIAEGAATDVVEMDAASNRGIDEIRALRERIHFAPTEGKYKVYIIDEVHMLTAEAFNALLKVLEEPPEHTVFVLCTTEAHKVPATISSRCQRFDFRRVTVNDMVGRLDEIAKAEGIAIERPGLYELALHAQGSLRDAISTLDQLAAFTEEGITADDVAGLLGVVEQDLLFEAAENIADGQSGDTLMFAARSIESGHDPAGILRGLLGHFRNLYVTKAAGDAPGVLDLSPEALQRVAAQSRRFEESELEHALAVLSAAQAELRGSPDARLLLEITLVRLARPVADVEDLTERVAELERRLRHGAATTAHAQPVRHARPEARAPGREATPPAAPTEAAPSAPTLVAGPPAEAGRAEALEPAPSAEAKEPEAKEPAPPAEAERAEALEPAPSAEADEPEAEEPEAPEPDAPEPVPPAKVLATIPPGELTTVEAQRRWGAFLGALGDPRLSGPLNAAEPAVSDGRLIIEVPDEFRRDRLQEKLPALLQAAADVFGEGVEVEVQVGEVAHARHAARRAASAEPAMQLKQKLGAEKVQEIRDADDRSEG